MIIQPMTETSVVTLVVELAVVSALITKEVEAVIVPTDNMPKGFAPVEPGDCLVNIMIELAVTAVVAIVAVPLPRVTVPKEFAPAVVVDATLVLTILLPAVPRTRLPLVAVTLPVVAMTPVPPVTVVPATTVVPEARVVVVVREPGVVIAAGRLNVTVDPEAAVVIWLAVPAILMLPPEGVAVPLSPVRVLNSMVPPPDATQRALVTLATAD